MMNLEDQHRVLMVFSKYCTNGSHVSETWLNFSQSVVLSRNFNLFYKLNQTIKVLRKFRDLGLSSFFPMTTYHAGVRSLYLIDNRYFRETLLGIFDAPPPLLEEVIAAEIAKKTEKKPRDKVAENCILL